MLAFLFSKVDIHCFLQMTFRFNSDSRKKFMNTIINSSDENMNLGSYDLKKIQCIPLSSLLLAINVTEVDVLSLDIEGKISRTFSI